MRNILMGVLSILILLSIFPVFNLNANQLSKTPETGLKTTLLLYGENESRAKIIYNREGENLEYILTGHNLIPNTSYTLVYYPEDVNNILCLGDGVSNMMGQMSVKNSINIPSIPYITDPNSDITTTTVEGVTGAKIWMIPSHLINCYDHIFDFSIIKDILYPDKLISYTQV